MLEGKTTSRYGTEGGTTEFGHAGEVSASERQQLIAKAAYYRAEKRGFTPGHELQDWLEAESEVSKMLRGRGMGRVLTPAPPISPAREAVRTEPPSIQRGKRV